MKRYASHFLFLHNGYLKHCVIETEEGFATRIFPLTEEIENVEWLPGAIILLADQDYSDIGEFPEKFSGNLLKTCPLSIKDLKVIPIYFPHFDIKTMLPVAGTRHKQLP